MSSSLLLLLSFFPSLFLLLSFSFPSLFLLLSFSFSGSISPCYLLLSTEHYLAPQSSPCSLYPRENGDDSSHGTLTSVKTTLMQVRERERVRDSSLSIYHPLFSITLSHLHFTFFLPLPPSLTPSLLPRNGTVCAQRRTEWW